MDRAVARQVGGVATLPVLGATTLALLLLSGPLYRLLQARGVGPAIRR